MRRTLIRMLEVPPSRSISRSWSTRSSLTWVERLTSPISSRKMRPALGELEPPFLRPLRAGEGALLVAEELGLDQRLGERRATHLDERLLGPRRVVVDRVRDHLLAGPGLAADQHRRIGARDLGDLLVDLLNRGAVADDAAERVLVAQLVAQVLVLLGEAAAIRFDRPPQLQRLRDHRRDDAIELERALIVAVLLERQHDLERPPGPPPDRDRHGQIGELAPAFRPLARRRRQRRLLAHPRHDHRLPGVDHPLGDPIAGSTPGPLPREPGSDRRLRMQFPAVGILQEHGAADDLMPPLEQVEHGLERRLEIEHARERLADFEQSGEPPDLVRVIPSGSDADVGHF